MEPIAILEFPSNLGLREPAPGKEPGVWQLPAHFRKYGLHDLLQPSVVHNLPAPGHTMNTHQASGVRNAASISAYAEKEATLLNEVLDQGHFPLVLGGDCSITIGIALGLKQRGCYGLFYLDGHSDFMLPELSHSGAAAGMDLAFIAGRGHALLSDIDSQGPYINEDHIWCAGNRDYDKAYVEYIENSRVAYYDLRRLEQEGITSCTDAFLKMVDTQQLDGFWVHFDVDVLHNAVMPAVDSPDPGGMSYNAVKHLLTPLVASKKLTGINITILDPDLDPDGKYVKEFISNIGPLLQTINK